jgi:phosphate transport system substrate-binding protein
VKTTLSGGGATKGIRSASSGTSDMGGTCRHWLIDVSGNKHPEEVNAKLVQVAWDAIVVVVSPSNPVNNISLDNLKKVYNGEITNWKDLGGPDKPIALVTRAGKISGVGHMFRRMVFGDPDYTFKARSLTVKSSGPLEKKVEKLSSAMGLDGISSAKRSGVKVLALDGVEPTKENIGSGKYPLWRPLYLAINEKSAKEETKKFVDFALSEEGQAVISAQGTVNLSEGKALKPKWEVRKKELGL